jgi:3',5'-cyclic AMP phosphodiesterase CpdA
MCCEQFDRNEAGQVTRIAVTSDLHLGLTEEWAVGQLVARINRFLPDLTIVAGDVAEGLTRFRRCLDILTEIRGTVAVMPGNHDLWANQGNSSTDLYATLLPEAVRSAGMLWLEGSEWNSDDCAVVGQMSWYDYSAGNPKVPSPAVYYARLKQRIMRDAIAIDWPDDDLTVAKRAQDSLLQIVNAFDARPDVSQILVVTHVPLFKQQLVRRWWDGNSSAYFANLTAGAALLAASHKVTAVISGHTHRGCRGSVRRADGSRIHVQVVGSDYRKPKAVFLITRKGAVEET